MSRQPSSEVTACSGGRSIRLLAMVTRTPTRYTPRNRAELVSCLIGLGDNQPVELKPNAAKLLRRRFRTVPLQHL